MGKKSKRKQRAVLNEGRGAPLSRAAAEATAEATAEADIDVDIAANDNAETDGKSMKALRDCDHDHRKERAFIMTHPHLIRDQHCHRIVFQCLPSHNSNIHRGDSSHSRCCCCCILFFPAFRPSPDPADRRAIRWCCEGK